MKSVYLLWNTLNDAELLMVCESEERAKEFAKFTYHNREWPVKWQRGPYGLEGHVKMGSPLVDLQVLLIEKQEVR